MGRIADEIEQQLKGLTPKEAARVRQVLAKLLKILEQGGDRKAGVMEKLFGARGPGGPGAEPEPAQADVRVGTVVHDRVTGLAPFYRRCLLKDALPFWFPRCIDRECGGFLHSLDADGSVVDTDKSVWAQGRMSWMLLTMHNTMGGQPEWLEWGEHGLKFLREHCFDEDGRMFFHVTREGRPIRKRRYAYSECFASIAFAAHARATGRDESATRAVALLRQFIDWNFTAGRMPPKFTGTRPMIGIAPRMMALATAQELRENLGKDALFDEVIDRNIAQIERLFCKPEHGCVMESVAPDGAIVDCFDGRTLNPGHAIEAAWFILREGNHRSSKPLVRLGCRMLDWMWARGWDDRHGGLFYFRDLFDRPVQEYWHDMKFWWPHDEAITATLMAWLLTGDEKYRRMHQQAHEWSFKTFADPEHGEWFGYAHRDGRLSNTLKGSMWKSFFHHPRMLWMCWRMCQDWVDARPAGGAVE